MLVKVKRLEKTRLLTTWLSQPLETERHGATPTTEARAWRQMAVAARRIPRTTDAGRREPKPEPGRVARQAKVRLGRGARRGGAARQGQAPQEAPPPSGPAVLGSLGSGQDAARRPAASPRSPALPRPRAAPTCRPPRLPAAQGRARGLLRRRGRKRALAGRARGRPLASASHRAPGGGAGGTPALVRPPLSYSGFSVSPCGQRGVDLLLL